MTSSQRAILRGIALVSAWPLLTLAGFYLGYLCIDLSRDLRMDLPLIYGIFTLDGWAVFDKGAIGHMLMHEWMSQCRVILLEVSLATHLVVGYGVNPGAFILAALLALAGWPVFVLSRAFRWIALLLNLYLGPLLAATIFATQWHDWWEPTLAVLPLWLLLAPLPIILIRKARLRAKLRQALRSPPS